MLDSMIEQSTISQREYYMEQMLHHYHVEACNSICKFFNGADMPWRFFQKLEKALVAKEDWAEDICYQADLNDKEVAALKNDINLLGGILAEEAIDANF